jgi:hypothetical protein
VTAARASDATAHCQSLLFANKIIILPALAPLIFVEL